jgi:hypothetical protein
MNQNVPVFDLNAFSEDNSCDDNEEVRRQIPSDDGLLQSSSSQVSSPRMVDLNQLPRNSSLTSSSSSFSPFSPSSPSSEDPSIPMDVQFFTDLIERNKRLDREWKQKKFEDVYPVINDTIRLESAICSPKTTLVKELRYV